MGIKLKDMKVSERIRQVHNDLVWCEAQDDVGFNMQEWVEVRGDGTCSVCVAGAYIYRNHGDKISPARNLPSGRYSSLLEDLDPEEAKIIASFDGFREGYMASFLYRNGVQDQGIEDQSHLIYDKHSWGRRDFRLYGEEVREDFRNMMLEMADYLESEGY